MTEGRVVQLQGIFKLQRERGRHPTGGEIVEPSHPCSVCSLHMLSRFEHSALCTACTQLR